MLEAIRRTPIHPTTSTQASERAILAQCLFSAQDADDAAESLEELARLADTAGIQVAGRLTQRRERPTPAHLFGAGKIEDLHAMCEQAGVDCVIVDNPLSSVQSANLTQALGCRVMDRTELILWIFARRARSAEARAQVELAQLRYLLSRVPEARKQQRFKGNIGMRGPGESPLQLRNVPMRRRIRDLSEEIERIRARRARSRARRKLPVVSLVGYTNAGKSTLLNALTRAQAYVDDRLFATLDTTARQVWLGEGRQALLADTVGFIRNLPHPLVAAFRSTLDVAIEADLLLVVVDASHPKVLDQLRITRETLAEIGADRVPAVVVLNKCDLTEASEALLHVVEQEPGALPVSALRGRGLDRLREVIREELDRCCSLSPPPSAISGT